MANDDLIAGLDPSSPADLILVNAPLRDYAKRPRVNDFTLPVLGMAYIATYATHMGYNVGVLDAEAHGISVSETLEKLNSISPRWVGMNLLAPTYELSAQIASGLDSSIKIMLGGHHAKALPTEILRDRRFNRCEALIVGEGETRVVELLEDVGNRRTLPGVMWLDGILDQPISGLGRPGSHFLAPDIDAMPFVDRVFLTQDPFLAPDGRIEANMVGARGCPYDCSFCGAAVSANPDITIRTRSPGNILAEMNQLRQSGVTAFRFVDDLFLGASRIIKTMMEAFTAESVGEWAAWDATGRINVLDRLNDGELETLASNGLREVALGIESGSQRMLDRIDKRITPEMARRTVTRLTERGINVKGYFIVGFPTETDDEIRQTTGLIADLWDATDPHVGRFRSSIFEYRPYPGTPDWGRLLDTGNYTAEQLLSYSPVDLTDGGVDEAMRERDEFNFSVNLQLSEADIPTVRAALRDVATAEYARRTHS